MAQYFVSWVTKNGLLGRHTQERSLQVLDWGISHGMEVQQGVDVGKVRPLRGNSEFGIRNSELTHAVASWGRKKLVENGQPCFEVICLRHSLSVRGLSVFYRFHATACYKDAALLYFYTPRRGGLETSLIPNSEFGIPNCFCQEPNQ